MREGRHRRAERSIDQHLLRCVGDMVIAAHDVRNLHLHIVHDDGQMVGRVAIGPHEDEVFDMRVIELDMASDDVVE